MGIDFIASFLTDSTLYIYEFLNFLIFFIPTFILLTIIYVIRYFYIKYFRKKREELPVK